MLDPADAKIVEARVAVDKLIAERQEQDKLLYGEKYAEQDLRFKQNKLIQGQLAQAGADLAYFEAGLCALARPAIQRANIEAYWDGWQDERNHARNAREALKREALNLSLSLSDRIICKAKTLKAKACTREVEVDGPRASYHVREHGAVTYPDNHGLCRIHFQSFYGHLFQRLDPYKWEAVKCKYCGVESNASASEALSRYQDIDHYDKLREAPCPNREFQHSLESKAVCVECRTGQWCYRHQFVNCL